MHKSKIILCTCSNRKCIDQNLVCSIKNILIAKNIELIEINDLCSLAVNHSSENSEIAHISPPPDIIIACSQKAVKAICQYMDIPTDDIKIIPTRTENPQQMLQNISKDLPDGSCSQNKYTLGEAWNPFIDYSKCIDCGQCYEFCIFKVYSRENGKIIVTNPEYCKDNCPACARICPANAIVFPKCPDSVINGSKNSQTKIQEDQTTQNIKNMFQDDIMKTLAERRQNNIFKK